MSRTQILSRTKKPKMNVVYIPTQIRKMFVEKFSISDVEIKVSHKFVAANIQRCQIITTFYVFTKKGRTYEFVPSSDDVSSRLSDKRFWKTPKTISGTFVPVDDVTGIVSIVNEDFVPEIPIYTKPPQAGKTHDCVVVRMILSFNSGNLPILIIPSKIGFQKQSTGRLVEGANMNFIDGVEGLSDTEKDQVKANLKCFKKKEIGLWDSGAIGQGKLSGDVISTLKDIRQNKIKALVVLKNKAGLGKMMCLLSYMLDSDKGVDIIVDESHGFFDISPIPEIFDLELQQFQEKLAFCKQRRISIDYKNIPFDSDGKVVWLMKQFLEKKGKWSISGLTATTANICKNTELEKLGIGFPVIRLDTPECYIGYNECEKKLYNKEIKNAFEDIINIRTDEATVMCHSGHRQSNHTGAAKIWARVCKSKGISESQTGSMIDNADGYTLMDSKCRIIKCLSKKKCQEPWQAVNEYRQKFPFLGIFGDMCMGESATYQKCTDEVNCYISDIVAAPFDKKYTYGQMTKMLQKIGRVYTNDTSGENNRRIIWFSGEKDMKKFETSLALENRIQKESTNSSLVRVDYKTQENLAKRGKIDIEGDVIITNIPNERASGRTIPERFAKFKNQDTCIANFVKNLDPEKVYTHDEICQHAADSGYLTPRSIIISLSNDDSSYSFHLLEKEGDSYRLLSSCRDHHKRIFRN